MLASMGWRAVIRGKYEGEGEVFLLDAGFEGFDEVFFWCFFVFFDFWDFDGGAFAFDFFFEFGGEGVFVAGDGEVLVCHFVDELAG